MLLSIVIAVLFLGNLFFVVYGYRTKNYKMSLFNMFVAGYMAGVILSVIFN